MVRHNNTCCDPEFKQYIKHRHRNCHKKNSNRYVIGKKLNAFYNISLKEDKCYKVCSNIFDKVKNFRVPRKRKDKTRLLHQQHKKYTIQD